MPRTRSEYHFNLPRRKRVDGVFCRMPLGALWLIFSAIFMCIFLADVWWAIIPSIILLFLSLSFLIALSRLILFKNEPMCLAIDENGVGFGAKSPEFWVFADGIESLKLYPDGYWMLHHVNGTRLCFPSGVVSDEDIAHLHSKKIRVT